MRVYLPGIGVPIGVFWVLAMYREAWVLGTWVRALPHLNGVLNGLTALGLVIALWHVRHRRIRAHRRMIRICLSLGACFLSLYLIYHLSTPPTRFGDINQDGLLSATEQSAVKYTRPIYLGLLLSHTLLASVVIWLVLQTLYYAQLKQWTKHRKWAKWAFPIWLYVSISGCLIYALIQPYY